MLNKTAFNGPIDQNHLSCPKLPLSQDPDNASTMDPSKVFESEGPLSQSEPLLHAPDIMAGLGSSLRTFAVPNPESNEDDEDDDCIETTRLALEGTNKNVERLGTAETSANSDDEGEHDDNISPLEISSMRSQLGRSAARRGFGSNLISESKDSSGDEDDDDDDDNLQAAAPIPLKLLRGSNNVSGGETITHRGVQITASRNISHEGDDNSMRSNFSSDESMRAKLKDDPSLNLDESMKSLWISNDSLLQIGRAHDDIFDRDFNEETKVNYNIFDEDVKKE